MFPLRDDNPHFATPYATCGLIRFNALACAHVGGFVAGAMLGFVFRNRKMLAQHPYYGWTQRAPTDRWKSVRR